MVGSPIQRYNNKKEFLQQQGVSEEVISELLQPPRIYVRRETFIQRNRAIYEKSKTLSVQQLSQEYKLTKGYIQSIISSQRLVESSAS